MSAPLKLHLKLENKLAFAFLTGAYDSPDQKRMAKEKQIKALINRPSTTRVNTGYYLGKSENFYR